MYPKPKSWAKQITFYYKLIAFDVGFKNQIYHY